MSMFKITSSTKIPDDLYEVLADKYGTLNGYLIYPKNDEVPMPWDADMYEEGDKVVLDGHMAPGGPEFGTCVCKIPKSRFNEYFDFDPEENHSKDPEGVVNYLTGLGFVKNK